MRKLFVVTMVAVFVLSMVGNAWAAGWWRENANDTINQVANNGSEGPLGQGTDDWSLQSDNSGATSPHGGFSATSNKCKTCHAVHGALSDSFRLLKNNSRADECNYCHIGASGASKFRLYAYTDLGITVRGEHTLGSTQVPDSGLDGNLQPISADVEFGAVPDRGTYDGSGNPTLFCFSCHSVHGAYTISDDVAGWWTRRILRTDPGILGGGYDADGGLTATNAGQLGYGDGATIGLTQDTQAAGVSAVASVTSLNMVRSAFCGGCHTKNFNYRRNMADGQDYSLQKGSHPLNTDGTLEVGGGAGVSGIAQVSWTNAGWCGSCHNAPIELGGVTPDSQVSYAGGQGTDQEPIYGGFDWNTQWYAAGFPHQSESNKLLFDDVQTGPNIAGITNDAYRAVDGMDKVCGKCHSENGDFTGDGVGSSF